MKVIIVEDEAPAAEKLERYLLKYDANTKVLARLDSVRSTVEWLQINQELIDLIFMDIQLIDGLSFQVFQQVKVKKPVIFTTAFNEFALDAFKVNSIDYLLKPITFTDLSASLQKLETLREQLQPGQDQSQKIQHAFSSLKTKDYKTRFMVKLGEHIRSITAENISLLYAEGRDAFLLTTQNKKFIIDYTLEALEDILDPAVFFRLNRTFIVNINAVKDVIVYSNSRLKIILQQEFDKEIIVSREKVNDFKEWFDGVRKT
ncbi:LytR/AlgR family response regulator transcription factor [Chryseosolibacter indicus]|uniref:LytTR family DNA-binding domain-containing protein n=1 Tax=Chryseosolibacter indicus TaxID=2782351 RepID=A0ABS5VVW8_9BACT|nr:LytTR family DNA-binding domain-containing protein [Chryseosolibacter indicus]MBT1704962.1 LytTR family DNA-binding domain-containing protein [Chryseosolibacter indicus]